MGRSLFCIIFIIIFCSASPPQTDQENLLRAVEYFQSGKYHEALLLFGRLEKKFNLNPRLVAYTGVCQFYDHDYKAASNTFDSIMPKLKVFAPHELSIYYYCAAESKYQLEHFNESITLFEKQLLLCYDNEKGDALLRIGICYKQLGDIVSAQEYLIQAIKYYKKYNDKDKLTRMDREIKNINKK